MSKGNISQIRTRPLDHQESATVYHYQYWDDEKRQLVTSEWEATLECIRCGLGAPIVDSGRQVPASELDTFGRLILTDRQRRH